MKQKNKRIFKITHTRSNGEKGVTEISARGFTSACHAFCGYRKRKAIQLGVIDAITEIKK